jgi:cell division protease FtsH
VAERANEAGEKAIAGRATEAPPRPAGPPRAPDRPTGGDRPPDRPPWKVEGGPPGPGSPDGDKPNWGRVLRRTWWLIVLALIVNWIIASTFMGTSRTTVSYTFFRDQVQAGNVSEVTSTGDTIEGAFRKATKYPPDDGNAKDVTDFTTQRPAFGDDGLTQLLLDNDVTVNAKPPDQVSLLTQILVGFGPTLLFIGLGIWFFRRMAAAGGGLGGLGGIGRSRAKRYEPEQGPRTTFADVAGIDEVKNELAEVVDFLRNPGKYTALGAAIPKGVLLAGAPGTGKTLLARAVAGEANVPFFHLSASEFIEFIVGVGASRVRDLFETAKKAAPAIIFIDELDAIGRARGGGSLGGVDEREQTLNQILTEMDGFTGNEGVVVLAATNRPDVLDSALLRPGRFDRRVTVSPPDQEGRRMILEVHTRRVPLGPDVDLAALAATTQGMVGADLRNLVNEAALTAARRGHSQVQMADFTDALEKVVLGTPRKIMLTVEERRRTAHHEGGHALLGMLTPGADPVRKVSITPRGHALGVTFQSPDSDQYAYSEDYLRGRIVGALGGKAAEEVVYGTTSTGAESDLDQVSRIARQMVGRWGMSTKVGPLAVLPAEGTEQPFLGDSNGPSQATRELVDVEARRIVDECYERALEVLRDNRDRLERLAEALLRHETLDADAAYAAAGVSRTARPDFRPDQPGTAAQVPALRDAHGPGRN